MLDVQVGDALNAGDLLPDAVGDREHAVQVVAEELDGDAGLRAAQHGVDAVADRLSDLDVGPYDGRELLPHVVEQLAVRAAVEFERCLDLRDIDAQGVLVELGAARLAGHGPDLGDREQQLLGLPSDAVRLLERDARQGADVDRERPLVERGQETPPEREEGAQCGEEEHGSGREHAPFVVECPEQGAAVVFFEPDGDERLLRNASVAPPAEQVAAQHGGERQGHDCRGEECHDEGHAQRDEHAPLHAREEEERDEADDDDECRVEDRHAHLARGVEDHLDDQAALCCRQLPVLAQVLPDVLHIDNGVIDERADGDGHAAEAHRVERQPEVVQHEDRDEQRERQRDERDERRAGGGQEEEEDDDHEYGPLEERVLHVVDRTLDKARLAEDVGRDLHVPGQVLLQVGEGLLEFFGQLDGSRIGLFGHGQKHRRTPLFGGQAQPGLLGAHPHVGDVGEADRGAVRALDHGPAHLGDVVGRDHAAHDVFVAVLVDDAAVGVAVHPARDGHHLAEAHAVVLHALGVEQDLVLLDVATEYGHLRHASGREQPRADCPVGQRPQVEHRGAVGRQADDEQLAEDRRLGPERRVADIVGKALADGGELLGDDLTVEVDVCAPFELDPDDREAGGR